MGNQSPFRRRIWYWARIISPFSAKGPKEKAVASSVLTKQDWHTSIRTSPSRPRSRFVSPTPKSILNRPMWVRALSRRAWAISSTTANCRLKCAIIPSRKMEPGFLASSLIRRNWAVLSPRPISFTGTSARPASLIRSRNSVMTTLVCPVCPLPRRISKFRRKRAKSLLLLKKKSIRSNASSAVG